MSNIYVNGDTTVQGFGTELSPFTYEQIRNYFNPDIGDSANAITPAADDVVYIKGALDLIASGIVFNIKRMVAGKITVKAWDVTQNGLWLVESVALSSSTQVILVDNEATYYISELDVSDFALLGNNGASVGIKLTNLTLSVGIPMAVEFKNFMMFCENIITAYSQDYVTQTMRGFNIKTDADFLCPSYTDGNNYLYDGAIKAASIIDYL